MKLHVPFQPILEITALNECMDANFQHPYYFPGEFHPFWELVYVIDGKMQAAINENIYTMQKGDLIVYKPMEFHRLWTIDDTDIHAFIIGFSANEDLLSTLSNGAYTLTGEQQQEITGLLDFLHSFLVRGKRHLLKQMLLNWEQNAANIHIFVNRLENFLISLATHPKPLTKKTVSDSVEIQIYRSIVAELNAHVDSWITTGEIAQKLHCSPAHINRVFAKYSDIGVHKYLLKLKIAAAIRRLREGVPVAEISAQLAFSNQNYFSSVFKRETGFSPTEYIRRSTEPRSLT